MLPHSPPSSSSFGRASINHDHNITSRETELLDSLLHLPQVEHEKSSSVFDPNMMAVKKMNHNASERDRRKKMNSLFSTLGSLLPASDETKKKLSIPNTVSRVLKYIPELQKQVERLAGKKEELISKQGQQLIHLQQRRIPNSLYTVSASLMMGGDVMIQISDVVKSNKSLLFEAIQILEEEEEGFCLINASSFRSFGGRVFYNLHLQVQGPQKIEIEMLRKKLSSLCE